MAPESKHNVEKPDAGNPKPGIVRDFLLFVVLAGFVSTSLAIVGGLMNGKAGIEKTISELCYPVGFAWLIVCSSCLFHAVRGRYRLGVGLGLVAAVYWVCGTEFLPNAITNRLEQSVEGKFDPQSDPPLDTLVVLGGGTSLHETRAQAASSGDRVLLAAQLFHGGHTRRLVTTGRVTGGVGLQTADLGQQTIEIWTRLGIPRDKIDTLPGMNTYQEIQAIYDLSKQAPQLRLGVLTSALHLPRAMRLAKAAGFTPIPVAADYRVTEDPRIQVVPTAEYLEQFENAQHEYMAYVVGR